MSTEDRPAATLTAVCAVLLVAGGVGYLWLAPPTTGARYVVAPVAVLLGVLLARVLRAPRWWSATLLVAAAGGGLLGAAVSATYAFWGWAAPLVLGLLAGAASLGLVPRSAVPDVPRPPSPSRRELREWAASYGVPVDALDLAGDGPVAPASYGVEQIGSRWRTVQPVRPGELRRRTGAWRRSEERAVRDLWSELAYRYR